MFDSGFTELLLIFIVALIVFGPERLPELARKAGYWIAKLRRYANTVRSEIERELNAEEFRSMLSKQEEEIRELRDMLKDTRIQVNKEIEDIDQEVKATGEQAKQALADQHGGEPGDFPSSNSFPETLHPDEQEKESAASAASVKGSQEDRHDKPRAAS